MNIRLSSDQSPEAQQLKRELEARGYVIEDVLSGSSKPVAISGKHYIAGYLAIRYAFIIPSEPKYDSRALSRYLAMADDTTPFSSSRGDR